MESSTQLPSTSTVKKFEYEYFYKFSKRSFLVVTAQNLSQKHKRIHFFCKWDVKKVLNCKRQFSDKLHTKLLLYFKQIRYLDVESKCTFFARQKKPWLAEAANCSIVARSAVAAAEKCLTLKLSKELA